MPPLPYYSGRGHNLRAPRRIPRGLANEAPILASEAKGSTKSSLDSPMPVAILAPR